MNPPKWAQDLTLNTLIYLHGKGFSPDVPNLVWRHRHTDYSTGGCCVYGDRIRITANRDRTDNKVTLLHELAHWALPPSEHHSLRFWELAWELYRWAKLPIRYCLQSERYYSGSAIAYHQSRKINKGGIKCHNANAKS